MVDAGEASAAPVDAGRPDGRAAAGTGRADGRALRWAEHNESRRRELVNAAFRAIRVHGAGVGMDEIAAEAQTSKTVIYRHFGDRAGVYRAVAGKVERRIVRQVHEALAEPVDPRTLIAQVSEAYLALVEADPEVYRFVLRPPLVEGPVADAQVLGITAHVAQLVAESLRGLVEPERARTWAIAIVGSVHAVAEQWMADPTRTTRARLVDQLADLAWGGLARATERATDRSTDHPSDRRPR